MPYIIEESEVASANGWPMFRALFLEYPDDPGAWKVDDQYLFGSKIMVAPLLEPGSVNREVYLPGKVNWVDYQTGDVYSPGWQNISAPKDGLQAIILVPQGTVLKHVPVAQSTSEIDWNSVFEKNY